MPGWCKMPAGAPEALRLRAERILPAGEGHFPPSGPPQVADLINHRLLVAASDVVAAVVAAMQPDLSGKKTYRLLARVVADALCCPEPFITKDPLVVGPDCRRRVVPPRGGYDLLHFHFVPPVFKGDAL